MQNFKSMLVKMSNLELCCDYYLRTFMFYSTNFGNKLHVLSFLFLAFVLFFTPFLLMNRNCWCYRNKAKGLQNNSGPMLSLKLTFIAISCAQSETVEEKSYSALLLTAADRCKIFRHSSGLIDILKILIENQDCIILITSLV